MALWKARVEIRSQGTEASEHEPDAVLEVDAALRSKLGNGWTVERVDLTATFRLGDVVIATKPGSGQPEYALVVQAANGTDLQVEFAGGVRRNMGQVTGRPERPTERRP